MKKINKYILLLAVVFSFSCSSDDDNSNDGGLSVSGTYTLDSLVPSSTIDADANGTFTTEDIIDLINCDFKIVLTDNTITINMDDFSVYQPATVSSGPEGVELDLELVECQSYTESGTYTVEDGSLISTIDEEQNILAISGNEITLIYTSYFHTSADSGNDTSVQFTAKFSK
ncbi:hypothetical protein KO504_13375 [Winogradskyella psychrotolerans]|uniref:hypothetical protein n=1 Tax=Winogradskyella psychrotolerans TaxID=1344585 RepID=UPI001C070C02|nr:hypothetical protein [Winogradskyella psychrotolerans]MBU2922338.1 hypothetical protein [Winogradskyella psychrotolerans]